MHREQPYDTMLDEMVADDDPEWFNEAFVYVNMYEPCGNGSIVRTILEGRFRSLSGQANGFMRIPAATHINLLDRLKASKVGAKITTTQYFWDRMQAFPRFKDALSAAQCVASVLNINKEFSDYAWLLSRDYDRTVFACLWRYCDDAKLEYLLAWIAMSENLDLTVFGDTQIISETHRRLRLEFALCYNVDYDCVRIPLIGNSEFKTIFFPLKKDSAIIFRLLR